MGSCFFSDHTFFYGPIESDFQKTVVWHCGSIYVFQIECSEIRITQRNVVHSLSDISALWRKSHIVWSAHQYIQSFGKDIWNISSEYGITKTIKNVSSKIQHRMKSFTFYYVRQCSVLKDRNRIQVKTLAHSWLQFLFEYELCIVIE